MAKNMWFARVILSDEARGELRALGLSNQDIAEIEMETGNGSETIMEAVGMATEFTDDSGIALTCYGTTRYADDTVSGELTLNTENGWFYGGTVYAAPRNVHTLPQAL